MTLAEVKVIARLQGIQHPQLAHVQHPPHQAGEAAAFPGNDLQILPLVFRRDGTVQNTIGVTGDGVVFNLGGGQDGGHDGVPGGWRPCPARGA